MTPTRFFFYGTLMSGMGRHHSLEGLARPVSPALMRGDLLDVGCFPAVVHGAGVVVGELWEVLDEEFTPECLRRLDAIESYHPERPAASLYLREEVQLLAPATSAWTYTWNAREGDRALAPIPSGDYRKHCMAEAA